MSFTPQEAKAEIRSRILNYVSEDSIRELNEEGFTDTMILAFIKTAKHTKSIISSRLPGGVGLDLINEDYDLKGFQVKAKSCNWGPMAGFICQLPLLNKYGYKKIDYNAGYIADYIERLTAFSPFKSDIQELISKKKSFDKLFPGKENPNTKLIIGKINEYKLNETTAGKWSGENSLPTDELVPFIKLKRKFGLTAREAEAKLLVTKGIDTDSIRIINEMLVYGKAFNVTDDENPSENKPTVFIEFLLRREPNTDLWAIYHGEIKYKNEKGDTLVYKTEDDLYDTYFGEEMQEKYPRTNGVIKNIDTLNRIYKFSSETTYTIVDSKSITFYAVQGIMNPHPPYPLVIPDPVRLTVNQNTIPNPEYYKNAVSGDYDLFAFWPESQTRESELTRLSEHTLDKDLKFNANSNQTLCIEFIPGFKELNPSDDDPSLKESAELGNVSPLGQLVAGTLNSYITAYSKKYFSKKIAVNKAFHSDEGGRPGITEIEFPIAFFFPEAIQTTTLGNVYLTDTKRIPKLSTRTKSYYRAGLIKTPEELLELICECVHTKKYRSMIQADWLIYMFYIVMEQINRTDFLAKKGVFKSFFDDLLANDASGNEIHVEADKKKQIKLIDKKIKEFKAIDDNFLELYSNSEEGFNSISFKVVLKDILGLYEIDNGSEEWFIGVRNLFLKMAFQPNKKAIRKKVDVCGLLYPE